MNEIQTQAEQQWDAFLQQWPLSRLRELTLEEYYGTEDSFFHWIAHRTRQVGEYNEGPFSAGIRLRAANGSISGMTGVVYDEKYIWYRILGETAEEAFATLKAELLVGAEAAMAGELERTRSVKKVPGALFWKVVFLYQDRDAPGVLPIYSHKLLRAAGQHSALSRPVELHPALMAGRGEEPLFGYAARLVVVAKARLGQAARVQETLARFDNDPRVVRALRTAEERALFARLAQAIHEQGLDWWMVHPDQAGSIRCGRNMALENSTVAVVAEMDLREDGVHVRWSKHIAETSDWQPLDEALVAHAEEEDFAAEFRAGSAADRPGRWPVDYLTAQPSAPDKASGQSMQADNPRNQILYGPPGTGKTFAAIDTALKILDPDFLVTHRMDRQKLRERFDTFAKAGQVRLVTFHQSFSYEDFVEGLRAETSDESQLAYNVKPGVFKRVCDDARTHGTQLERGVRSNPRIWKISINGTGDSQTKSYCLEHGEARIGWGDTGDLRQKTELTEYYERLGAGDKGTLQYFAEEMSVGDVLLCIHSADEIGAVGVVTGDYRYEQQVPAGVIGDYQHVRPVNWVYQDVRQSIQPLNDNRQFTLKTVYHMPRFTWADLVSYLDRQGVKPVQPVVPEAAERKPHVLIIDEINRGNVSRIFGELITLIEPSKREGAAEALSVELPYSKKPFSVPDNVYLIGTMNTADRSLAGLDIALRRRFVFAEMPPRPDLLKGCQVRGVSIGQLLEVMNQRIELLLDRDHCLGHAYFMPLIEDARLERLAEIFRNQVLPLLQEYFFEDWQRIQWVLNDHRKAMADRFIARRELPLSELFGSGVDIAEHNQPWGINAEAFTRAQAYLGIIDAALAVKPTADLDQALDKASLGLGSLGESA